MNKYLKIPYWTGRGYDNLTLISKLSPGMAILPSSARITSAATSAVLIKAWGL